MTAFVGRRRVLDALDAAFAVTTRAPSGLPRLPGIVLITGAAGMGKTSLLARWAGSAEGARVAWGDLPEWGRCAGPVGVEPGPAPPARPPDAAMLSRLPAALSAVLPEWAGRTVTVRDTKGLRPVRERDRLLTELRRAARPDGRTRQLGASTTERSRKAVTARIRDAIDRIRAMDPDLAGHLDGAVRTGVMCRYQPEVPA